jgi:small subunit ribosomal protein S4e
MGRKGSSKHLKRLPAPAFWPIHRKEFKWVSKPKPGPHKKDRSFPLLLILREMLGLARTRREAHRLLSDKQVKVDGVARSEDNYPAGLMDVVEIPIIEKSFRILPIHRKGWGLHPIGDEEKGFKLCKIMNKTNVKGGNLQLNLHDGRNILLNIGDPENMGKDVYKTHDVLKIGIPRSEILNHLPFDVGVLAIVENGKNRGRRGEVVAIEKGEAPHQSIVTLRDLEGDQFKTVLDYVFPVGKDEPWISLPEEAKE